MAQDLNALKSEGVSLRKKIEAEEDALHQYLDDIHMPYHQSKNGLVEGLTRKEAKKNVAMAYKKIKDLEAAINKNTKDIAAATKAATASKK